MPGKVTDELTGWSEADSCTDDFFILWKTIMAKVIAEIFCLILLFLSKNTFHQNHCAGEPERLCACSVACTCMSYFSCRTFHFLRVTISDRHRKTVQHPDSNNWSKYMSKKKKKKKKINGLKKTCDLNTAEEPLSKASSRSCSAELSGDCHRACVTCVTVRVWTVRFCSQWNFPE